MGYLKRLKLNRLTLSDAVVFLDVPPVTACQRIDKRGEQKQVHETEEKLGKLREAYHMVCDVVHGERGVIVSRLDAEATPENIANAAIEFLAPEGEEETWTRTST